MRKSIYLLLTLLIASTSYSSDVCLKVSQAFGTSEGYLVLKADERSREFYMDFVADNALLVLDKYCKVTMKKECREETEYHASKNDKEIIVCYSDFEVDGIDVSKKSKIEKVDIN